MPLSYRLGNRYKSATVRILVARYNNRVEIAPPNEEFLVSFFMYYIFFWRFCDSIMQVSFLSIVFFLLVCLTVLAKWCTSSRSSAVFRRPWNGRWGEEWMCWDVQDFPYWNEKPFQVFLGWTQKTQLCYTDIVLGAYLDIQDSTEHETSVSNLILLKPPVLMQHSYNPLVIVKFVTLATVQPHNMPVTKIGKNQLANKRKLWKWTIKVQKQLKIEVLTIKIEHITNNSPQTFDSKLNFNWN